MTTIYICPDCGGELREVTMGTSATATPKLVCTDCGWTGPAERREKK